MSINIDDLANGNFADNGFDEVDPNLAKNPPKGNRRPLRGSVREIDPVKEYGMKSQKELDIEDDDKRVPEDKIFDDFDKMLERKEEEYDKFSDIYDQTEGNVEYEDIVEMEDGFDPIAMMANPPRPGHANISVEQKKEMLRQRGLSEDEINKILGIRTKKSAEANKTAPQPQEKIEYENDEVDEDELLEKEIEEGIPLYNEPAVQDTIQPKAPTVMEFPSPTDTPVDNSVAAPKAPTTLADTEDTEDDDLKALDDDFASTDSEEEITKHRLELLKEDINKKIKPVGSNFNITGFTISKQPVSLSSILGRKQHQPVKTGDWVLPCSERSITMTSFNGSDLDVLTSERRNRNTLQAIREVYGVFYNHIVDEYKPADLESWAKTIAVTDIDHLYACAYRATFEGVNFVPYDCPNPKCNNSFVTNSLPFMDMVKFKDEKAKEQFNRLIDQPSTPEHAQFKLDIIPISEDFAFGVSMPTLYNVAFINAMLDDKFKEKYAAALNIAAYVEGIYYIANGTLQPISVKTYSNNEVKSTKAKIITISKIIKELNSDQYNALRVHINSITENEDGISYIMPAVTCEKCKTEIEETILTASQLLFLRHHLASLVNG